MKTHEGLNIRLNDKNTFKILKNRVINKLIELPSFAEIFLENGLHSKTLDCLHYVYKMCVNK